MRKIGRLREKLPEPRQQQPESPFVANLPPLGNVLGDGPDQTRNRVFRSLDIYRQAKLPKSRRSNRPNGSKPDPILFPARVDSVDPATTFAQECHEVTYGGRTCESNHIGAQ